ncbi:MAG TPA: bifunctional 5,10-methylenetetrahydrofolate dehydrogenase/5,10-methenyltetrahydrofolate cyclohydrolase [Candidatus Paceibacterota bacterium]
MIIDGKKIAADIYQETADLVHQCPRTPVMAAITCAPNFETKKYLDLKVKKAAEVGITLRVIELPATVTTQEAIDCVRAVAPQVDGIVVQLPFPPHIAREQVLAVVPPEKDPDGFSYGAVEGACLPPVVGAIVEIAQRHNITFDQKHVVVLGQGRLVGAPVATFLNASGAIVQTFTEADEHPREALLRADVLVTGIGKAHFVTPDMVPNGIAIFDAGTSEDGGVVVGDVHPDVAEKAALFTPVPGGIGPITVALLLRNLVSLIRQ